MTSLKEQLVKKSVITANKALIAEKGEDLFELSNKQNSYIGYEASVAGAIPVISSLTHNMLNENIISISGIINGHLIISLIRCHLRKEL